jgi:hypothetical protein
MRRMVILSLVALAVCLGLHLLHVYALKDQCDVGFTPEECARLPDPKILGIWEP